MKTTSQKIRVHFLSIAAVLFAAPFAAQAVTVDGQYNDWDLENDFSMPMYRAGDPDPSFSGYEVLSNAYLRYDSNAETVYVLVLDAEERADITLSPSDAWVKIYDLGNSTLVSGNSGNDGEPSDFAWVTDDQGGVIGWEGSFLLSGSYEGLEIHVNHGSDTSSTGKRNAKGVDQTKTIDTSELTPDVDTVATTYSVSGTVFMDADWSGANESEPGLSNVTVELHDSLGNVVASGLTSESGEYEFVGLPAGDYQLVVQPENAQEDFNELLTDYFVPTTDTEITLSALSEDSAGNDFGFAPDTTAILDDFDQDDQDGNGVVFEGNGKTIGFWKHQNKVADSGKGRAQVDAVTLQGYIDAIEELLLPEPFQFDDANEFMAAHDVMAQRTSDAVELLKKQLLGTEFNDVSGRGLEAPYDELQDKIIALAEHLAANSDLFTREELLDVKDICDLINNSGNLSGR
jgi:hypothetical protein